MQADTRERERLERMDELQDKLVGVQVFQRAVESFIKTERLCFGNFSYNGTVDIANGMEDDELGVETHTADDITSPGSQTRTAQESNKRTPETRRANDRRSPGSGCINPFQDL